MALSYVSFNHTDVYNFIVNNIQLANPKAKLLMQDSVSQSLVTQYSLYIEELSSYINYLAREQNYELAQEDSTMLGFTGLIGLKPKISHKSTHIFTFRPPILEKKPEKIGSLKKINYLCGVLLTI